MSETYLIAIAIGLAVVLTISLIALLFKREAVVEADSTSAGAILTSGVTDAPLPPSTPLPKNPEPGGAVVGSRVFSASEIKQQKAELRMIQAGLYRKDSNSRFYLVQIVAAVIPLGLAYLFIQIRWLTPLQALLMASATAIAAIIGPGFLLDHKKSQRQSSMRRALPDALDVVVVCLEAGISLSGALARVSKELTPAYPLLAAEFTIVFREVQLGTPMGEALLHMANRFDLEELRSLALVVRQAEKFGASLSSALRIHAETLRTKRFQAAQEKAQKAAVKLLLPTVLFIFPSLFVVILGPAAYDIFKTMSNTNASK